MKLLRLKLENFRQHANTDVQFSDGMTAIVGPNGTGKTTLLEAITFALFGDIRAGKVEDLRFFWAEPRKKYIARLRFQLGDKTFEVERSTYDASLKEVSGTEKTWATGKAETTQRCEALLGLTYEQFINSFCAEQKGLRFLQFKDNRERQAEVARMLGYDKLEKAENLGSERRKDFAKQRGWIELSLKDPIALESEKQLSQQRLNEAKAKLQRSREVQKEVQEKVPIAKDLATTAAQWLDLAHQMEVIRSKAEGLKANLKTTEDALLLCDKDIAEFALLKPREAHYQEVCKRLAELAKELEQQIRREQMHKEADGILAEMDTLKLQIESLNAPELAPLEEAIQVAIHDHTKAQEDQTAAQHAWANARVKAQAALAEALALKNRAHADLQTAEAMVARGECPECGQPITKTYGLILESRKSAVIAAGEAVFTLQDTANATDGKPKELIQAEAALQNTVDFHRRAQAELEAGRRKRDQAKELHERQSKLSSKREGLLKTVAALPTMADATEKPKLESLLKSLEPDHSRYLSIQNCEEKQRAAKTKHQAAKQEHEEARDKYRDLNKQRTEIPFSSIEEARQAEETHRQLTTHLGLIEKDIVLAAEQENSAKKELEAATRAINEQKDQKKKIADLHKSELLHGATAQELKTLRLNLNAELGPELEARASENISLLTNSRYCKVSLDKNFAATLFDDGDIHKPVISGGEEDVLALALRLALSELIQERQGRPMSLLILDEVFGSLDADRRACVMDRLSALKGRFEQILVISHIEEINQVADQCLYISRDPQTRAARVSDAPLAGFAEL